MALPRLQAVVGGSTVGTTSAALPKGTPMGGPSVRRIASTALCAALLAGATGPAAVAADDSRERVPAAAAPVPGVDALLEQVKGLGDLGTVLTPVTELLNTVLKADNGQLAPHEAGKLVQAAKDAIATVNASLPVTTPSTLPAPYRTDGDTAAPAPLVSDAPIELTRALDDLLRAVTSGDADQVTPAVSAVLTDLVAYLTAVLLDSGLPTAVTPEQPTA
jgi:hypothetical protein